MHHPKSALLFDNCKPKLSFNQLVNSKWNAFALLNNLWIKNESQAKSDMGDIWFENNCLGTYSSINAEI